MKLNSHFQIYVACWIHTVLIAEDLQRTSLIFLRGLSIVPLMYQKDYICLEFYSWNPCFPHDLLTNPSRPPCPSPHLLGETLPKKGVNKKHLLRPEQTAHAQAVYNPNLIFILIFLMRVHPLCRFPLAFHQAPGSELRIPKWALITSQEYSLRQTPSQVT